MQYIKHSFVKNFNNAVKYKDSHFMKDLLHDEIAKLIVHDKNNVVRAIINGGITIDKIPSNRKTAKIIITNISRNEKLRKGLIELILQHDLSDSQAVVDGAKEYTNNGKSIIGSSQLESLNKTINKYFKGLDASLYVSFDNVNEDDEKSIDDKVSVHDNNKDNMEQNLMKKPIPIKHLGYIYVGLAVIGYASFYYFNKKMAKKYGDGGEIEVESLDVVEPTPIVTPPSTDPSAAWTPPPMASVEPVADIPTV